MIVPPTVWAGHFLFCYLWVAVSCAKLGAFPRFTLAFVIGTGVALAIIAASGWIAWIQSRTPGDPPPHDEGTDIDRLRFLAHATVLLAALRDGGSLIATVLLKSPTAGGVAPNHATSPPLRSTENTVHTYDWRRSGT